MLFRSVRLPGGEMEAKFHADDNGSVGGELSVYKDGRNTGRVIGRKRDGEAFFFVKPTGRFGFGQATR